MKVRNLVRTISKESLMRKFTLYKKTNLHFVTLFTTLLLAALISIASVTQVVAQPSEVWVDDDYCISCPNDGHTWGVDAFDKIQYGIDAVAQPGTVYVAEGIYEEIVDLKSHVSLLGSGMGVSVIDGMGLMDPRPEPYRSVVTMYSNSKISDFSIINGFKGVGARHYRGVIIERNWIAHHVDLGIGLGGGNSDDVDTIVANNIVTDCGYYYGAIFGNHVGGSPQFINNTVVGNRGGGMGFWYAGTPIIKNNIVVSNGTRGINIGPRAEPINSYNNCWNNPQGNWLYLAPGEGAISEDPLFVDESAGDYHLQGTSLCINAGTTDVPDLPETDFERDPRVAGIAPDMGADEYYVPVINDLVTFEPIRSTYSTSSDLQPVLFKDDFSDGDNDGWTITRGDWDASAGHNEAITISDEHGEETAYAYAGDPAWKDYIFEADVTFGTGKTEFFVAVRAEPNSLLGPKVGKQYYLSVDGDNNVLRLRYSRGSSGFVDVQQVPYTLLEQATYHIKVLMNGVNLQASINGDALINYSFLAPIYPNGLIAIGYLSGFGNEGQDGAYFDNVKVYKSGCPDGFVGNFSFDARLTNTSAETLTQLMCECTTLTRGNLFNADGGPDGVGGTLTIPIPAASDYSDGELGPGEYVDVHFEICLTQWKWFRFFVDVRGVPGS